MPKIHHEIEGLYNLDNKKLTGKRTLLLQPIQKPPFLRLLDITDQVNKTGSATYISGLFKANTDLLREVYSLDYNNYYYSLTIDDTEVTITKKGAKGSGGGKKGTNYSYKPNSIIGSVAKNETNQQP